MPNEIAEAHWNYIKDLLLNHKIAKDKINLVGFHYKTAFVHGYKHGQEELIEMYKNKHRCTDNNCCTDPYEWEIKNGK